MSNLDKFAVIYNPVSNLDKFAVIYNPVSNLDKFAVHVRNDALQSALCVQDRLNLGILGFYTSVLLLASRYDFITPATSNVSNISKKI